MSNERRYDGDHIFAVRIYYEDTDSGGIVYHSNYLKFAERARTEFLRTLGYENTHLSERDGIVIAVRRCSAEFLAPARLDDLVHVATRMTALRGASMDARQIVRKDGRDLVQMKLTLACIAANGRPARLPPDLRAALLPYIQTTNGFVHGTKSD